MIRIVEQPSTKGTSLLEQYRASGSPEVFAQIMRAYGGMVFSVCMKVTKDAADAEDASQAAFLTLAVQLKTGATIHYLGPWLKKVAKRSSLDLVRSRKRRTRRETVTAKNRPDHYRVLPSQESEQSELQELIRAELDHLPAKYRMPLVLHYFGGMSHEEIGKEMSCTTAALGVRLHRARKMLGKRLTVRGITLETTALGAAIALSVNYYISERFIHTTTQAMLAMSTARPIGMSAIALGAHVPVGLGVVPQLVQEVAQSMARTRMRYATVALAMSVTFLGGAAEAVRHLPESIRPNLDFLSPSKALENLFRSPGIPRMQETPKKTPVKVVEAVTPPRDPMDDYPAIVPSVPLPAPSRLQPVLAFRIATPTPPISTHAPHLELKPQAVAQSTAHNIATPIATNDPPPPVSKSVPIGSFGTPQLSGSGGSGSSSESAPQTSPAPVHVASGPVDPHASRVASYVPPPAAFSLSSNNLDHSQKLQAFDAFAAAEDQTVASGPVNLAYSSTGLVHGNSFERMNDWLTLRSNDVFVHAGDGTYNWNDANAGILPNAANSVAFALEDVSGDGVMTMQKLANNTTLAPSRPTGHTFIGIWSVESLLGYAGIDLQVRYDDALAESLGLPENVLKLWVYDGQWTRINDQSFLRDLENHTLRGSWTNGTIEYFGVSAPEPTSVFGLLSLSAITLLRRRR